VNRMVLSLQTSNSPMSTRPPPSKLAATETVQPWSFGSLRVVLSFGRNGFEVEAVASSAVMSTMTAVCVLAFAMVTTEGAFVAAFFARGGFAGAVAGSVDPGAGTFCAEAAVAVRSAAMPAAVEKRIGLTPAAVRGLKTLSQRNQPGNRETGAARPCAVLTAYGHGRARPGRGLLIAIRNCGISFPW
jgi:hypothetical protein